MCAGGGGVVVVKNTPHAHAGTPVGRKLLSSQKGGPWDQLKTPALE